MLYATDVIGGSETLTKNADNIKSA